MTTTSDAGTANIARWVAEHAANDPNLPAIKQGETILSYGGLDAAVSRFATILSDRGVQAGDRVAMIMPNVTYFPIVYYAILRLGAIAVPMNPPIPHRMNAMKPWAAPRIFSFDSSST